MIGKCLIRVENPFGVQHSLKVLHETHSFLRFAVVDVVPLLEPKAVFSADASLPLPRPLIHVWLDSCQERIIFRRRCDVQMKVSVT